MAAEPSHIGVERQVVMSEDPAPAPDRPGLGTTWGEQVSAPISFSPFVRASSRPWAEALLHYNDAQGVGAHASYLGTAPQPLEVFAGDGSISIALVDEAGRTLPGYHAGGRALVVGNDGARYRIVVRNGTSARFEVVASGLVWDAEGLLSARSRWRYWLRPPPLKRRRSPMLPPISLPRLPGGRSPSGVPTRAASPLPHVFPWCCPMSVSGLWLSGGERTGGTLSHRGCISACNAPRAAMERWKR
jgi:hypothetical protein